MKHQGNMTARVVNYPDNPDHKPYLELRLYDGPSKAHFCTVTLDHETLVAALAGNANNKIGLEYEDLYKIGTRKERKKVTFILDTSDKRWNREELAEEQILAHMDGFTHHEGFTRQNSITSDKEGITRATTFIYRWVPIQHAKEQTNG